MYGTNTYFVVKKHDMEETKDSEEISSKDIWL